MVSITLFDFFDNYANGPVEDASGAINTALRLFPAHEDEVRAEYREWRWRRSTFMSADQLMNRFGLDYADAEKIMRITATPEAVNDYEWRTIKTPIDTDGGPDDIDLCMRAINEVLDFHGVEVVRLEEGQQLADDCWIGSYWGDVRLLYCNSGDSYRPTVVYDLCRERFAITTTGDWVEGNIIEYGAPVQWVDKIAEWTSYHDPEAIYAWIKRHKPDVTFDDLSPEHVYWAIKDMAGSDVGEDLASADAILLLSDVFEYLRDSEPEPCSRGWFLMHEINDLLVEEKFHD